MRIGFLTKNKSDIDALKKRSSRKAGFDLEKINKLENQAIITLKAGTRHLDRFLK